MGGLLGVCTPGSAALCPQVKRADWVRQPLDRFILARLEKEGLEPSPEADKAALLRRVSFDLTGLPPTPEEEAAFLADSSPGAYEKQVDRLLASPRYGERWASMWLDLARYADTKGYEADRRSPGRLAVPRLGDRCLQSQPALRPVRDQTAGGRSTSQSPPLRIRLPLPSTGRLPTTTKGAPMMRSFAWSR